MVAKKRERERVFVRYNLVIIPNYQYKDYFYIKKTICAKGPPPTE